METLQIELKNKKQSAMIKELLKELRIAFISVQEEKGYNPEFVQKILEGQKEIEEGGGTKITLDEI